MNKEQKPYIPTPEDVPAPDLSNIYSSNPEASNSKTSGKITNSGERKAKSQNNANISRTNLDTELIDVNADGDAAESQYGDLM